MNMAFAYGLGGLAELVACVSFWRWWRQGRSVWWAGTGILALGAFVALYASFDISEAHRGFAVFLGIFVLAWIAWVGLVERRRPHVEDLIGGGMLLLFLSLMLFGHR